MNMKTQILGMLILIGSLGGASAEALRVAVFDFELINSSTRQDPNDLEQERLAMLSERLRSALHASETFDVVDIAPVKERADRLNLQACGGCDRTLAEAVGADIAFTGAIHKMSELVLHISIAARDVSSGKIIGSFSAGIRGNNDRSWIRGLDWLVSHRIVPRDDNSQ
jgi:hypothetical protein